MLSVFILQQQQQRHWLLLSSSSSGYRNHFTKFLNYLVRSCPCIRILISQIQNSGESDNSSEIHYYCRYIDRSTNYALLVSPLTRIQYKDRLFLTWFLLFIVKIPVSALVIQRNLYTYFLRCNRNQMAMCVEQNIIHQIFLLVL